MKKTIALLIVFTLFISSIAFAEPAFTPEFDPVSKKITVSGAANGDATVIVTESGDTLEDLSDEKLPVDFHMITADKNFVYEFYMPNQAAYGKYNVYITDAYGRAEESFIYFDKSAADSVISNVINKAANEKAFIEAVSDNAEKLGIDKENKDYSEEVLEMMYALYNTYSDSQDFITKYNFCLGVCALKGETTDGVKLKLQKYANSIGIDYNADFANDTRLTDDVKKQLCTYLSEFDYVSVYKEAESLTDEKAFKAVYAAYSALAAVSEAESWKTIEKTYTKSYLFLKKNVVEENESYKSSEASSVFSEMANMSYEEISDLTNNFNDAVSKTNDDNKKTGGGSSGGGGGSSVSASSALVSGSQFEGLPNKSAGAVSYSLPVLAGSENYADVAAEAWYCEPISILGGSGIISGDGNGNFRPDDFITRAEFAKLVVSAFSISGSEGQFDDVDKEAWFAPYVQKAAGAGIIMGDSGNFRPNEFITRQDAAVIIYRIAELLGIDYIGFQQTSDMNDVSLYAWTAVGALYSNGVIGGVGGGKFAPRDNISRAQAAQLLYNAIKDMEQKVSEVE